MSINNKVFYLIFLVFFTLIFTNCKKEPDHKDNSNPSTFCYSKSFFDTISYPVENYSLLDYIEDFDGNIVMLGRNQSADIFLSKIDTSLHYLWTKTLSVPAEYNYKFKNDAINNYYLASITGSMRIDSIGSYFQNVWWQSPVSINGPCWSYYHVSSDTLKYKTLDDITTLTKLDSEGELLWTMEVPGNQGGDYFDVDENENIYIGTFHRLGLSYKMGFLPGGVFSDTIFLNNETHFNLYKVSSNGTIIWEKQFNIPTYLFVSWYSQLPELDISISGQEIFVSAFENVFVFGEDGELIRTFDFEYDNCMQFSCNITKVVNDIIYVKRYTADSTGQYPYTGCYISKYNVNGLYMGEVDQKISWNEKPVLLENNNLLLFNNYEIRKLDENGNLLWLNNCYPFASWTLWPTCNNCYLLITSIHDDYPGKIAIMRTNEDGIIRKYRNNL